jgi:hypothetical protein
MTGHKVSDDARDFTAHAICLPQGTRKVRYVSKVDQLEPDEAAPITVKCPKRFNVSGGGFEGAGDILTSAPFDSRDRGKAPDDGWRLRVLNLASSPDTYTVHAICLR